MLAFLVDLSVGGHPGRGRGVKGVGVGRGSNSNETLDDRILSAVWKWGNREGRRGLME